ncbi:MAG: DUF433 domain-containing protein [Candidatus Heimdallarchaeota archaeon]
MSHRNSDRIVVNPFIQTGKAIVKGTRITVNLIIDLLLNNWSQKQIIENYPQLVREDIIAAIEYKQYQLISLTGKILTKWNEETIDEFLRKTKNGSLPNAENDAIDLKQITKEKELLLEKKKDYR